MPTVVVNSFENARNILGNVINNGKQKKDLNDKPFTKSSFIPIRTNNPVKHHNSVPVDAPLAKPVSNPNNNQIILEEGSKPSQIPSTDTPTDQINTKEFSEIFADLEYNSEYIIDIYNHTAKLEGDFLPSNYFVMQQHCVTEKMRTILIEWLVQIQEEFQLCHETLYRAVAMKDLFLSRTTECIKLEEYQLVGSCCLWIASKYEEIYPPNLCNFASLCDNIYSRRRFIQMEGDIMRTLGFQLYMPVPYTLSRVLNKIVDGNMATLTLSRYICELTLVNFDCCLLSPSKIATSCLYIALRMFQLNWSEKIEEFTKYSPEILKPEITKLNDILHESFNSKRKTQIRLKYNHPVFFKVALKSPLPTSALF